MKTNSVPILQRKVRMGFEKLLETATSTRADGCSASEMERHLLKGVLQMGAGLMQVFLDHRCEQQQREEIVTEDGERLPYHSERERRYYSVFGQLRCRRPYFYKRGQGGQSPLDSALGLGEGCYSDLLREFHEELSVFVPYERAGQLLGRLLDINLSSRVMQQFVVEDGADVEAFYEQQSSPPVEEEGAILVAQADGKGVPMVRPSQTAKKVRQKRGEARSRKKTAVVTTVYTIAPAPRTAEEVLASLHRREEEVSAPATRARQRTSPQHKHLWATLASKDEALAQQAQQVAKRDGEHIQHRVTLCDGDRYLQRKLRAALPDFTLVLDFIHAYEYLWKAARTLYSEGSEEALTWVTTQTQLMLSGQLSVVIDLLKQLAEADEVTSFGRKQCLKVAGYFDKNQQYMDYATYLQLGWPIASGVIEAACRHLVKDRMELSGMRWSETGAEHLLRLRAVAENQHWEAYHLFRKQQRQQRLYGCNWPTNSLHWNFDLSRNQIHTSSSNSTSTVDPLPPKPITTQDYHCLPLAA